MTAPSNANTSGLENAGHIVWWKAGGVSYYPEGDAFTVSESCRVEPLVTAASAQARIAELEAELERWKRLKGYADDQIKVERKAYRSLLADYEARAALQQETQP